MSPLGLIGLALLGVALGPSLHHLGVAAGARRPFGGIAPRCPACHVARPLTGLHRRRCRSCGRLGRRAEVWVTAAAAAGFAGAGLVAGWTWLLPAHLWFVAVTLVLVVTDFDHLLIPNRVLYPGTVAALVLLGAGAAAEGRLGDLRRGTLGAAALFGLYLAVALAARGGFGFGDVKLAALLGLFTGFQGWRPFGLGIFLTGVAGGVPALALLLARKARPRDELPYGPAMVAGTWAALGLSGLLLG